MYKTKIICTLGPASDTVTVIRKMMLAGMDVARLNFSHGSHQQHLRRIALVRQLNRKYSRHIRILQDLEGYRIRVGRLKAGKEIALSKKQAIILTKRNILGEPGIIPFDYSGDLKAIKSAARIFIDDGNIELEVCGRGRDYLKARVVVAGGLKEHKGINIPDMRIEFEGLTDKDKADIELGIREKCDYIAQSFVRDRHDMRALRRLLNGRLPACRVIAKIENRQGIDNIDEIIEESDGIMIARGDMGVSIPIYEVPFVQKEIIRKCNRAGKFVITATQMLESMTERLRPTRAEVTDVANAILDGTNYLMLSAETAAGLHPVESVDMMNKIAGYTQKMVLKK